MSATTTIRHALPGEAEHLTGLSLRSKAHWGYSAEFMDACRNELTVTPRHILGDQYEYLVAVQDSCIVGFYALEPISSLVYELEALFVEPEQIGSGIGRLLIRHALGNVADKGGRSLLIQGDPHARAFYVAVGAREIGSRESKSIPGRALPMFELVIRPGNPDS